MTQISFLLVVLLGLAGLGVLLHRQGAARWATLVFALPLGVMSYFLVGIAIPRWTGVGRFYSVPFGAMTIRDWHIVASALIWMILWYFLLRAAWRAKLER
jgi:hypothetical protein